MMTGRGGIETKGKNDGFAVRTVMAMATEMAEARTALNQACVQFAALAAAIGVPINWDNPTGV